MLGSDNRIAKIDSWVTTSLKSEEPCNNGNNDSYFATKGEKPKKSSAAFEYDESNNPALTNSEECILSRFRNNNVKGEKPGLTLNDSIDEGEEKPITNDRLSHILSDALNKVELSVTKEFKEKIQKNYLLEKEAKLVGGINDLKDFWFPQTEKNMNDETRSIEDPVLTKKERLYRNRVESIEKLLNGRFDSKQSTKLNEKKENIELKAIEELPAGKDIERKTPQKLKEKKNIADVDGTKRRKGSNLEPNEPGEGKGNPKKRKTTKISPPEEPEKPQKLKRKATKDLHSSYMNELANLNEYKALLNKQLGKKFEGKKKKESKKPSPADELAKKPDQKSKVKKSLLEQSKVEKSEQEVLFNHFLTAVIRMVFKGNQKLSKPSLNLVSAFISEILEHLCLHATLAMQIKGHNSITKADLLGSIRASFPQVLIEKVTKPKMKKIEA